MFYVQPSVANATNIDTLLANKEGIECVKVPPENLQDKVFFIFNNLSMSNMETKVRLTQILRAHVSSFAGCASLVLLSEPTRIDQCVHLWLLLWFTFCCKVVSSFLSQYIL